MELKITYDDTQIMRLLKRLQAKSADMTPAMAEIGELVKLSVQRNFEDEGRPIEWKQSRRVKEQGGQTLMDTGGLKTSITAHATDSSVEIGTNKIYAAIHHFGGVIKPKTAKGLKIPGMKHPLKSVTMPARPFLMVQDADQRSIVRIIQRHLQGQ